MERSTLPGGRQPTLGRRLPSPPESPAERRAVLDEALATLPPSNERSSRSGDDPRDELEVWMDHVRYRRTRCPSARARLVEEYTGYARHLASRIGRSAELREDLEQVALEALVVAIDRFDPQRRMPFLGFALPTISGSLKRYLRDHGWALRVPRRVHELAGPVRQAGEMLSQDLGREPTDEEVADLLGVPAAEVRATRAAADARSTSSFDALLPSRGELGGSDPGLARVEDLTTVQRAVDALTDEQRELLRMYFQEGLSQSTIARHLGVSQMQVSRLVSRLLAQLRDRASV